MPDKTSSKETAADAAPKAAPSAGKGPKAVLKYHGAKDGRYLRGVPRRDLFAEDVRGLTAEQRRHALAKGPTGAALYTVTDEAAYQAAIDRHAGKE